MIAFRWSPGSPEPLLLLGNRDEFHARPSAPLAWWEGGRILAGRDLQAGGTWLGVSRSGRVAAVTNVRQPGPVRTGAPSRGRLPVRFLAGDLPAEAFLDGLRVETAGDNPFNLLLFDGHTLLGYERRHDRILRFAPGVHAVSNGDFDEPWPKVETLKAALVEGASREEALLALLADARTFPDDKLPHTGVPLAVERALSPVFVDTPGYGTRAATVVRIGVDRIQVVEQGFTAGRPGLRSREGFVRDTETP